MTEATGGDRTSFAFVARSDEAYTATPLTVEVPGVSEFEQLYEQAVPANPVEKIAALAQCGASWAEVIDARAEGAPHGFLIYWRNDVHGVMQLAHDDNDCIACLMCGKTTAHARGSPWTSRAPSSPASESPRSPQLGSSSTESSPRS